MGILSEKRNGRITASAISSILGVNPYQSADDQMRVLVRQYHKAEREFKGNEATEHGHKYESVAIGDYEIDAGVSVEQDPDFVIHPDYDWLGCTPDGYVSDEGMVEIKCPYYAKKPYTLEEKPMYLYQVYLQLVVTGRAWCDFYVWLPDDQHCERVYDFQAKKWFSENFTVIEDFYVKYISIIDDEKLSAPYLEDKELDLSDDDEWCDVALQYKLAKIDLEEVTDLVNNAKSKLLAIAKKHGKKCSGGGVMAYSSVRKGSVVWKDIPGVGDIENIDDYRKKDSVVWSVR